ncbi:hypothetical protein C8Q73DRAFT_682224 [Cubamyces lactineus]|nr:hypothetical protein C8Q73DRAFT_682224 [Cubamyces lactineus]
MRRGAASAGGRVRDLGTGIKRKLGARGKSCGHSPRNARNEDHPADGRCTRECAPAGCGAATFWSS